VALIAIAAAAPSGDVDVHGGAAPPREGGKEGDLVADLDRPVELHPLDRDRGGAAAGGERGEVARREVHLGHEPAAEDVAGRVGVGRHGEGPHHIAFVVDGMKEKIALMEYPKVGVIGTKGTIRSKVYEQKIKEANDKLKVASLATPLLAPMIEEGFFDNKISNTVINTYLSNSRLKDINALILACTHYPLIKPEVQTFYYGEEVHILDSAEIVAGHIKKVLELRNYLNKGQAMKHHFFVSDFTESFEQSTRFFFKTKIHLEEVNIWK
jgi:hypothetical protein